MAAPLEMPIGRLSLGERKRPIDNRAQTVQLDRPVHRLEIGAAADADRAGLNVGDIVAEDDDIFGDGVNIAARLEALAEPGGICVSARIQEDAAAEGTQASAPNSTSTGVGVFTSLLKSRRPLPCSMRNTAMLSVFWLAA
jgi:class 3 adenylate cyclase